MNRRLASARRRLTAQDEGFALMGAMMLMLVMLMVCAVVVAAVIQGGQFQRKQQDWNAALSAAQAGVDDYIQRLNSSNGSYYQYDGVTSIDPTNPAMGKTNSKPNFAPVPQSGSGSTRGYFHYTADTAAYIGTATVAQTGVITVTSTGRVGDRTRTLQTQVRRSGFLDTLYFTEYETQDPAQSGQTQCANKHFYDGRPSSCVNIQFDTDSLSGPVHSNDTILICSNVTFNGKVTTASPVQSGNRYYRTNNCGSTSGTTFNSGVPARTGIIPIPSTNQSLKQQTAATSSPRGCLFVGPTQITLNGNQMYVRSPWTKDTPVCQLNQWIQIPANGTVYVDDRPANGTSDVNSWTNTSSSTVTAMCNSAPGSGDGNPLGYPIANETGWDYACTDGDVFIQELNGSATNGLTGRLTVAAKGSIYITDNLHYASGTAMLGLIADQSIWYWHGTKSNGSNLSLPAKTFPTQAAKSTPLQDPTVSAAMVSLNHSIGTMNYSQGASLGTVTINGNLTQLYRGIVRQGSAGYAKNYVYDQRLKYDAPPHFLNPTTSTFVSTLSAELPAYTPTN